MIVCFSSYTGLIRIEERKGGSPVLTVGIDLSGALEAVGYFTNRVQR